MGNWYILFIFIRNYIIYILYVLYILYILLFGVTRQYHWFQLIWICFSEQSNTPRKPSSDRSVRSLVAERHLLWRNLSCSRVPFCGCSKERSCFGCQAFEEISRQIIKYKSPKITQITKNTKFTKYELCNLYKIQNNTLILFFKTIRVV